MADCLECTCMHNPLENWSLDYCMGPKVHNSEIASVGESDLAT